MHHLDEANDIRVPILPVMTLVDARSVDDTSPAHVMPKFDRSKARLVQGSIQPLGHRIRVGERRTETHQLDTRKSAE